METIFENKQAAFKKIVLSLAAKLRQDLSSEIKLLASDLGIEEDLIEDRRKSMWQKGGSARETVANRPDPKTCWLVWRDSDGDKIPVSFAEAGKLLRRTPMGVRVALSKNKGVITGTDDDMDIFSIIKFTDEDKNNPSFTK